MNLQQNSDISDIGLVTFPIKDPILGYKQDSKGTWDLVGNQLVYTFTQEDVKRIHSEELQKDLLNVKKVAKDKFLQYIKKMDDGLFNTLSQGDKSKPITLNISEFVKGERFILEQRMGNKTYMSGCLSLERLKERE